MLDKETVEALYAFGACLIVSGGMAFWVIISMIVTWARRTIRRIDRVTGYIEEQEQLEKL